MEKEIWKDVEDYEGMYKFSNMGNVKSLKYGKERILKPQKTGKGYLYVYLYKDGKAKKYLVHQLVATAFCENPEGYTEVNHIDENPENNCADNLEWCSRSYNCNYGTRSQRSAEKRRNDPRTSKPVIGIDRITGLIVEFASVQEAKRETGINSSNICACCKGKMNSAGGFYWMYV